MYPSYTKYNPPDDYDTQPIEKDYRQETKEELVVNSIALAVLTVLAIIYRDWIAERTWCLVILCWYLVSVLFRTIESILYNLADRNLDSSYKDRITDLCTVWIALLATALTTLAYVHFSGSWEDAWRIVIVSYFIFWIVFHSISGHIGRVCRKRKR